MAKLCQCSWQRIQRCLWRSWQNRAAMPASSRMRRHLSSCWTTAALPSQPKLQPWPSSLLPPALLPLRPLPRMLHMYRRLPQPAAAAAAQALLLGSAAGHLHSSARLQPAHHDTQQPVQRQMGNRCSRHTLNLMRSR